MSDTTEKIARICHEINRAYCESLGDHSQPAWEDAPQWQKDSAIRGVEFHLAHPDASPSASHDEWMRHKLDEGWTLGAIKDDRLKTHPALVPYYSLPQWQRSKDYLFRATVHLHAAEDL